MKNTYNIVICGDLCLTSDPEELFMSGNAPGLFKGILETFKQAGLFIGNLEFHLADMGKSHSPDLNGI